MTQDPTPNEPITTPQPVQPEYVFAPDMDRPMSPALYIARKYLYLIKEPAEYIRKIVVEKLKGPKYYWYHKKYRKALPIDECYIDDFACMYEANVEFKRNYMVDRATLDLLRNRRDNCTFWNSTTDGTVYPAHEPCQPLVDTYNREEINFFIKYGDLSYNSSVVQAYAKQKHRMIMERRRALKKEEEGSEEGPVV